MDFQNQCFQVFDFTFKFVLICLNEIFVSCENQALATVDVTTLVFIVGDVKRLF